MNRARGDEQAQPDELGHDPGQVGPDSAGQSGDSQRLSSVADAADESVQELAEDDQALEADVLLVIGIADLRIFGDGKIELVRQRAGPFHRAGDGSAAGDGDDLVVGLCREKCRGNENE